MHSSQNSRIRALDALRGIASASVVLQHTYDIHSFPAPQWIRWLVGESFGVPLFFAVSAFCLYYAMERHDSQSQSAIVFYLRRFFRIAPLFYALLLLYVAFLYWRFGLNAPQTSLLLSMLFVFNFFEGEQAGIVWASWTIGVEMAFYAVFPLIFAIVKTPWRASAMFVGFIVLSEAVLVLLPSFVADPAAYWKLSVFRHLPIFGAGIVAYQVGVLFYHRRNALWIGASCLLAALAFIILWRWGVLGRWEHHGKAAAAGLAVLGCYLCPLRAIVNRLTVALGTISYSLYLVHAPIIYYSRWVYDAVYALSLPAALTFVLCAVISFAFSVPLACAFYLLVERPGNRLGRFAASSLSSWRQRYVPAN
ncbi:acyltransferase family protein [Aminobacter aganoensis]|uniref:Peptidoglycan/LPS O-acetylase OafA/YrhL n=1 Tax=Aminobacter aganoensis TaxID=83264 RepID=A0A7X0KNN3_9HYPH|nr:MULTISPECIES: acyltransferase [Aminobacter]KQU73761.1 hypothetical protein ASC75_22460 [Aminobacter sp. DSM 101952]MBB6357342.1 peptidoglycan/LPS O-acetylase OafA/YrhL [Aminobacter aganoensis]